MRRILAVTVLALLAGCASSSPSGLSGTTTRTTTLTAADRNFIAQAAYGGLAEVEIGRLAPQRAARPQVRDLARTIVSEHTTANAELRQIAGNKGITPPTATDPGRQAVAELMEAVSGQAFDLQYLQLQLAEHETALALYDAQATSGSDPELRAFAQRWLPGLRSHTLMIRQLAQQSVTGGS